MSYGKEIVLAGVLRDEIAKQAAHERGLKQIAEMTQERNAMMQERHAQAQEKMRRAEERYYAMEHQKQLMPQMTTISVDELQRLTQQASDRPALVRELGHAIRCRLKLGAALEKVRPLVALLCETENQSASRLASYRTLLALADEAIAFNDGGSDAPAAREATKAALPHGAGFVEGGPTQDRPDRQGAGRAGVPGGQLPGPAKGPDVAARGGAGGGLARLPVAGRYSGHAALAKVDCQGEACNHHIHLLPSKY